MTHKYYYLSRPPGIGCQPDGFLERKEWYPKRFPEEFPRGAWGWVTYPERLPMKSIWLKDLFPVERVEELCFRAWQDYRGGNIKGALRFLDMYFEMGKDTLKVLAHDGDYWASLILETGCTSKQVKSILKNQ